MNAYLYALISMVVAFVLHELGHYLAFRFYRIIPKIRWHFGGVCIGEVEMYRLTPKQAVMVGVSGILVGLVALVVMTPSIILYLMYFVACSFDLATCYMYVEFWKSPKTLYAIDKIKLAYYRRSRIAEIRLALENPDIRQEDEQKLVRELEGIL